MTSTHKALRCCAVYRASPRQRQPGGASAAWPRPTMQMSDVTHAQWRAGAVSSSRWAEAIRGRAKCAAQEPPPAEGRAQRPRPGRAQGRADGGAQAPRAAAATPPSPPRAGAAGEAEDGNTLLRR